jgi:hypothetical protein
MLDALDRLGRDRAGIEIGHPLRNVLNRCFHPVNIIVFSKCR